MSKNSELNYNNLYFYEDSQTKKRAVRWQNVSRLAQFKPDEPFSINENNFKISFDDNGKIHGEVYILTDDIELEMKVNHSIIESLTLNGKTII